MDSCNNPHGISHSGSLGRCTCHKLALSWHIGLFSGVALLHGRVSMITYIYIYIYIYKFGANPISQSGITIFNP